MKIPNFQCEVSIMGIILTDKRKGEIAEQLKTDKRFAQLWNDYVARVKSYTSNEKNEIAPMYDRTKWWHYIWERVGDAAMVYAITGDEKIGGYVHDVTMEMYSAKKFAEWIGPWFRKVQDPPVGMLETAHISCALCAAYDMCPELFSDEEKETIVNSLKERILPWCKRFTDNLTSFANWKMVLHNGFTTAACILGDEEAIKYAVDYFKLAIKAYNKDSYGESVQYSNYASLNLVHAYEMLVAYNPKLADELDSSFEPNLMKWYAASFMYMKSMNDPDWGDKAYPRTMNFGDSAAIFRPTGDVLMHVAKRFGDTRKIEAGLAMWLFETTYKEDLTPYDSSTFGFFNQYHYHTFINYVSTEEVKPLSPKEAGMPLVNTFETGTIAYRNSWDNPKLILGIQGGYVPNQATGHRHQDQNSFILAYDNERILADPGHCCYRLYSWKFSKTDDSHNTWTFEKENGDIIHQTPVTGSFITEEGPLPSMNKLERCEVIDNMFICQSDCAKAYGDDIEKAQRTWIACGENGVFIVDRIKSKVPVKPISHFVFNNRGEKGLTDDRIFYGKRVVYRRNGIGVKFLPMDVEGYENEMTMDWGFMHDCYHPEPNRLGQGKEGSALIYNYKPTEFVTEYVAVYMAVFDTAALIGHWHTPDVGKNTYYMEPGSKQGGYKLYILEDGSLKVEDLYIGKDYIIE